MKKFLLLGALASMAAFASDVCTGGGSSVTVFNNASVANGTLLTSTDSCNIGGYVFSNFDVYAQTGFTAAGETFDLSVFVDTPSTDDIQFSYSASSDGSGVAVGDFILTYTLTPGTPSMSLLGGTAGSVTEVICSSFDGTYGETTTCSGTPLGTLTTNSPGQSVTDSNVTVSAVDYVAKDVSGGSELAQGVVPEPMTMSLMGIGLLGLGLVGRKLRK